ncbi:hypothetical protein QBC44DRAFT_393990 [Cladorrhinum sp. PSN332]|nr:hypothetical protein QBC44DRAFT_393990 [Cladorrhinum sp. PSN332]
MVNFALPTLALLALTPVIGAVAVQPRAEEATQAEPFSFVKWVDEIAANPNGTHLSPEQAYQEWERTVLNATETEGALHKRLRCNNIPNASAPVPDAVQCINYLASLGTKPCKVTIESRFVVWGNAEIWGIGAGMATHSSYCEHIARAAGLVMDNCWRADNTVQGDEMAWGNGNIAVHIIKKGAFD